MSAAAEIDFTLMRGSLVPEFEEIALLADAMKGAIECPRPGLFGNTPNRLIAEHLTKHPRASVDKIAASVPELWRGRVLVALIRADELPPRSPAEIISGLIYVQDSALLRRVCAMADLVSDTLSSSYDSRARVARVADHCREVLEHV